jgi:hypothetical protein
MLGILRPAILASGVLLILAGGAMAQEEEEERELGWSNVADVGLTTQSPSAPRTTSSLSIQKGSSLTRDTNVYPTRIAGIICSMSAPSMRG